MKNTDKLSQFQEYNFHYEERCTFIENRPYTRGQLPITIKFIKFKNKWHIEMTPKFLEID